MIADLNRSFSLYTSNVKILDPNGRSIYKETKKQLDSHQYKVYDSSGLISYMNCGTIAGSSAWDI